MKTRKFKRKIAALLSVAALSLSYLPTGTFSVMNNSITEVKAAGSWQNDPGVFGVSTRKDRTDAYGNVIHVFDFWYWDVICGYYDGSDEAFILHVNNRPLHNDEIYIPSEINGKKITSVCSNAFNNCSCARVVLPDTLKTIEDDGFYCSNIKEMEIPDSVENIGSNAFSYSGFTKLVMPKTLTTVSAEMFKGCDSLKSLDFNGPVDFEDNVFENCTALEEVNFPEGSRSIAEKSPFYNCPKLKRINGKDALSYVTDSRGNKKPVFNNDLIPIIKEYFKKADAIGFIDQYCTDMCNYIVAAETDPWMNDFYKARQLYDWLILHCKYEDCKNGEKLMDTDNHLSSSVLLSAALNERGEGIGESVCDGFSQTYTMLLSAANIESYQISAYNHSWNAVVIGNQYYQCDPTWDSEYYYRSDDKKEYCTFYQHFMKNNTEMTALHGNSYKNPYNSLVYSSIYHNHPLLTKYMDFDSNKCLGKYQSKEPVYTDENQDGIIDYDYDLDGRPLVYDFMDDLTSVHILQQYFYTNETEASMNNRLPECLYNLHLMHKSWWQYLGRE